jgi:hypothetical protein
MINKQLINLSSPATSGGGGGNQEEGLILHLDANDVDSYDGDGTEWVDIANHEYTPSTDVSEHFNTVIYNGNGSSSGQAITGVGFKPDLVWVKKRNAAGRHQIQHSLEDGWGDSSDTIPYAPSQAHIDFRPVSTFDSDGFTIPTNYTYNNHVSGTYAAWCFKAGGAPSGSDKVSIDGTSYATMSAAELTDGTELIDKLSVNTKLGFSIVKYTAPALTGDTVAHGLGESPEMIILKSTNVARNWNVFHKDVGLSKNLHLNTNDSANTGEYWTANSSTFSIQDYSSSADWIAYCFASKRGVSKVGSYTGNGTTDNKIVTGFEPAFVMIKNTSSAPTRWLIMDNARDPDNPAYKTLTPDVNYAEDTNTSYWSLDWEADGFRLKYGADSEFNQNGGKFIYYAVAKNTNETSLTPTKDDFTAGSVETTNLELDLDANSYSGSGDWLDGTSNDNDGTITGASYVNDGSADYFSFDGSNDEVSLNSGNTIPASTFNNCTFEYWIKLDNLLETRHLYIHDYTSNNANFVGLSKSNTNNKLMVFGSSAHINIARGNTDLVANKWTHIAVTLTSSQLKIYIDGELDATVSQSFNGFSNPLYGTIGVDRQNPSSTGNKWLNGQVGQFRIYSSALTQAQIESNYEATKIYNTPELKLHLDAASFDGSTNTPSIWTDSSSNSNNGTISGATFDSELGNWLNFDGSNDYVQLPLNLHNTAFSVEFWAKDTLNSSAGYIIANSAGSTQAGWLIDIQNGKYNFRINNGSSNHILLNSGAVDDTVWHHVVVTWDNTTNANGAKIYINGSLSSQGTSTATTSFSFTNSFTRLMAGPLGVYHTDGSIGQVRMYHSALTQAQIRQNYNFTKPNYPNGYNGTITGATWNSGGYFDFDGNSDYVVVNNSTLYENFSISLWAYFDSVLVNGTNPKIFDKTSFYAQGYSYFPFSISLTSTGTVSANLSYGNDYNWNVLTNASVVAGKWYHIAVTVEQGDKVKLWATPSDGTFNTAPSSEANHTGTVIDTPKHKYTIGRAAYEHSGGIGASWFDGKISKVKMYDKVLTASEIDLQFSEGE